MNQQSTPHRIPGAGRRTQIRRLLFQKQSLSIPELSDCFGVTEMTIRRDLEQLEQDGHVSRTHGGAMLTERMVFEFDFGEKRERQQTEKKLIAWEARKLIKPGDRVILDTGTTTLELAVLLRDCEALTAITTSLAVASELQFAKGVHVVLLGGEIRRGSPDLTGAVTEHCLDLFAADFAFQGADGIGLDGSMYNEDMRLAQLDKKMRRCATRSFVLCDSTKIGKTALARNGSLTEMEALITDDGIRQEDLKAFTEMGVKVLIAGRKNTGRS
jgi:DeoR family transcriptional regulator, fructose operon transcriptional repressor